MNLFDKPDAEKSQKRGEFYESYWRNQRRVDDELHQLALLQNKVTVEKNTGSIRPDVEGFRTGFGLTIPQEQAAFMTDMPDLHVGNPTPEDESLEGKINSTYEPWLIAAWKKSQQAGQVWTRGPLDLKILGRYWDNILPHPFMWADEEYTAALKKRNTYTDAEQIKTADRNLLALKAKKFPIRWVYVPTRTCYTSFESEYWLPEVYEVRMMDAEDIRDRWGDKAIPGDLRKGSESTGAKLKTYIGANHCYAWVIIPSEDDPKVANEYCHDFYRSPYGLCEAGMAPENDLRIRWLGMMYGARYMINTLDEGMSDQRELARDHARTPRIWQVNMRERGDDDPLVKARAKGESVDIVDGSVIDVTENIILAPVPVMNPVLLDLQRNVQQLIERVEPPGIQRAEVLSGQSQNTVRTSFDIANKAMGQFMTARSRHAEDVAERLAACVQTLDDEVPVFSLKKGKGRSDLISINPDEADYIRSSVQATVGVAIPTDVNSTAQVMATYQNTLGIDPAWVLEKIGHVENADQVLHMSRRARYKAAVDEQVGIPMTVQRLQQIDPTVTPEQMAQINALFGNMPPDIQDFLAGTAPPEPMMPPPPPPGNPMPSAPLNGAFGGGMTGPELQGQASQRRPEQQPQIPGAASGQQ